MKRATTLLLITVLVMCLVVGGCSQGIPKEANAEEGATPQETPAAAVNTVPQELTYVINYEADKLDPGVTSETYAGPIITNAFDGLVQLNQFGEPQASMAEKWEIKNDGKLYIFHLRKGLKWSNGDELTANDFVYSWKRVLTQKTAASYPALFYSIKGAEEFYKGTLGWEQVGIKAKDNSTLEVELSNPLPYFLQLAGFWAFYPVHQATVEAHTEDWHRKAETYISCGPFRVTALNFGESVVFEKNPYYWDADSVNIQKLTMRLIPEESTALMAMESKDVEGIYSVPASEIPRLRLASKELYITPKLSTSYYLLNNKVKPLDDERVRKAFNLAIDRQKICDEVLQGGQKPAFAIVPYGLTFNGKDFREEGGSYGLKATADVEQARTLLEEAGYPDGKGFPKLTMKYWTSPSEKKVVETLQQMWKENLNVDIKIENSEFKVFFGEVQNLDYDIAALGWSADYPHPMTFLEIFGTTSPNNNTNWGSKEYDDFIRQANEKTNVSLSVDAMHSAEDILMKGYHILPIYHRTNVYMISESVEGWSQDASGFIIFRNAKKIK